MGQQTPRARQKNEFISNSYGTNLSRYGRPTGRSKRNVVQLIEIISLSFSEVIKHSGIQPQPPVSCAEVNGSQGAPREVNGRPQYRQLNRAFRISACCQPWGPRLQRLGSLTEAPNAAAANLFGTSYPQEAGANAALPLKAQKCHEQS